MGDEPRVRISSTAVTIIAWNAVAMATMDLIPFQIPEILFRFQIGVEKRKQENNHQMKTSSLEFCTTLWKWTVSEQILWASPADFQGAKRKRKRERERERERENARPSIDNLSVHRQFVQSANPLWDVTDKSIDIGLEDLLCDIVVFLALVDWTFQSSNSTVSKVQIQRFSKLILGIFFLLLPPPPFFFFSRKIWISSFQISMKKIETNK